MENSFLSSWAESPSFSPFSPFLQHGLASWPIRPARPSSHARLTPAQPARVAQLPLWTKPRPTWPSHRRLSANPREQLLPTPGRRRPPAGERQRPDAVPLLDSRHASLGGRGRRGWPQRPWSPSARAIKAEPPPPSPSPLLTKQRRRQESTHRAPAPASCPLPPWHGRR